jgi:hypothetical protein
MVGKQARISALLQLVGLQLVGCAVLAYPRAAVADSCWAPRQLAPLDGAVVPSDTLIWDICYKHSPEASILTCTANAPTLTDSSGRAIELVVDRQVEAVRYVKVVTAYRPREALTVGERYRLEVDYSPLSAHEFTVVEPAPERPAPPLVSAVDFSLYGGPHRAFNARFEFEPFEGNLVADPTGSLSSELDGLDVTSWPERPDEPVYYLANEPPCYVNFPEAAWGATAEVRFGVLSLAGAFSGWSEPISIQYPSERTDYPEIVARRERRFSAPDSSSCSVANRAPSLAPSGLLAALLIVGALRRITNTRPGRT